MDTSRIYYNVVVTLIVAWWAASAGAEVDVQRSVREPVDRVGYTWNEEGIARVVEHAREREEERMRVSASRLGLDEGKGLVAAVSPHDDYAYAQQVYAHVYPHLTAKTVILVGVAHKARDFPGTEGKLVFESFDAWRGPYGEVAVSPLRDEWLAELPEGEVAVIEDDLHRVEHSLEALIPWLQHHRRDVEIVPILVPAMTWDQLDFLAERASDPLTHLLRSKGWALGEDVAILISSDAVHYGDEGWGGGAFADFGVDGAGYDKGVARDLDLVQEHLAGELSPVRLGELFHRLVQDDVRQYKITWCGRFSIPWGLGLAYYTNRNLKRPALQGELLRYGTTLDPGRHDPGVEGLGVTAPANLHHWVGFFSMGFR